MDNDVVKRLVWSGLLAGIGALASVATTRVAAHDLAPRLRGGAARMTDDAAARPTAAPTPGSRARRRRRRRHGASSVARRTDPAVGDRPPTGPESSSAPRSPAASSLAIDPQARLMATPRTARRAAQARRRAAVQEVSERGASCSSARRSSSPRPRSPRRQSSPRARSSAIAAGVFLVVGAALLPARLRVARVVPACPRRRRVFWGFFIVAGVLFLLGALAGFLAVARVQARRPPTPDWRSTRRSGSRRP